MASKYNKKFEVEMQFFIDKTIKKMDTVRELAIYQLFMNIVDDTPLYIQGSPVRGLTKWNWQISIGTLSPRVLKGVDPSGKKTKDRGYAQLKKLGGMDQDIYIHNSVPWIFKLENGGYEPSESDRVSGGFSKLAPQGMVKVNALMWNETVNNSAKVVRN